MNNFNKRERGRGRFTARLRSGAYPPQLAGWRRAALFVRRKHCKYMRALSLRSISDCNSLRLRRRRRKRICELWATWRGCCRRGDVVSARADCCRDADLIGGGRGICGGTLFDGSGRFPRANATTPAQERQLRCFERFKMGLLPRYVYNLKYNPKTQIKNQTWLARHVATSSNPPSLYILTFIV